MAVVVYHRLSSTELNSQFKSLITLPRNDAKYHVTDTQFPIFPPSLYTLVVLESLSSVCSEIYVYQLDSSYILLIDLSHAQYQVSPTAQSQCPLQLLLPPRASYTRMKLLVKWFPSRMSFHATLESELTGSELKKRQKEREKNAQKAAKAAAAPPVAQKKTSAAAAEDELDPSVSWLIATLRSKLTV